MIYLLQTEENIGEKDEHKRFITNTEKNTSNSENSTETDKSFENKLLEKIKKN